MLSGRFHLVVIADNIHCTGVQLKLYNLSEMLHPNTFLRNSSHKYYTFISFSEAKISERGGGLSEENLMNKVTVSKE